MAKDKDSIKGRILNFEESMTKESKAEEQASSHSRAIPTDKVLPKKGRDDRKTGPEQTLEKEEVQQNSNAGLENRSYITVRLQGEMVFGVPKTWVARERQSEFATFLPLRD
ncbi:hypothetical protein ACH5RR_041154 [Cinchona calisaya]|uniref:Uncharacterized protein n=1 Tax=Cinchona calisaya TaxID=153742 RepID=A0ABD2XXZ7_9GENT